MKLGIPQIILLTAYLLGLGVVLAQNGQPKKGKESFGMTFLGLVFNLVLLYWGGFFG